MITRTCITLSFMLFIIVIAGCSGFRNPVNTDPIPEMPSVADTSEIQSGIGIFGAYTMTVNPSTLEYELTPLRQNTIGESFIVDGASFFTTYPCTRCFYVSGISGDSTGLKLEFYIEHPMYPGNPGNPPSGLNRLDLDVFDPAIVVWPFLPAAQHYDLLNVDVMTDFCLNPSGYTSEFSDIYLSSEIAAPYFLVVDDSISGTPTWNKFAMGDYKYTTISFKSSPWILSFNLYLTMGYGASATFLQRLTPKYYNPEFNRKPAWKVTATPQNHWVDNELGPVDVRVEVYDWQQGATVYPNPDDFANAPVDQVYEASNVSGVWIEIPGMYTNTFYKTTPDSGTGMPGDPLVYSIPVYNHNFLPAGSYIGCVRVWDTRIPDHSGDPNRDCIVTSSDGKHLIKHSIPEYATYQTFVADVWLH
jgi:hypothetical protein